MTETRALPEGWRWVRFGDVVRQVKQTTKDPESEGLTRIVGLEHLDSESLPLRRWHDLDDLSDGTSFNRIFRAGQVLFGKRRAYQRKVAIADFDGVCSGDILVFEPSGDELLAEFLPYIVQSDGFFDHALGTSSGSLSPRTKWQDLARYEFGLPPVAKQHMAIQLCSRAKEALDNTAASEAVLDRLIDSVILGHYRRLERESQPLRVTALADLTMGRQKAPKYEVSPNPTPYVRVANMAHLELQLEDLESMDFDDREIEKYCLRPGDVLLTEGDIVSPLNVGRGAVFPPNGPACCFQNTLIRLRPHDGVDPTFLMAMVEGARLTGRLAAAASTTTVTHLGLKRLSAIALPTADGPGQVRVADQVSSLLDTRRRIRSHRQRLAIVERALRVELMRGRSDV